MAGAALQSGMGFVQHEARVPAVIEYEVGEPVGTGMTLVTGTFELAGVGVAMAVRAMGSRGEAEATAEASRRGGRVAGAAARIGVGAFEDEPRVGPMVESAGHRTPGGLFVTSVATGFEVTFVRIAVAVRARDRA